MRYVTIGFGVKVVAVGLGVKVTSEVMCVAFDEVVFVDFDETDEVVSIAVDEVISIDFDGNGLGVDGNCRGFGLDASVEVVLFTGRFLLFVMRGVDATTLPTVLDASVDWETNSVAFPDFNISNGFKFSK